MKIFIKQQNIYEDDRMKVENPNYVAFTIEITDEDIKKIIKEFKNPYLNAQYMRPPPACINCKQYPCECKKGGDK